MISIVHGCVPIVVYSVWHNRSMRFRSAVGSFSIWHKILFPGLNDGAHGSNGLVLQVYTHFERLAFDQLFYVAFKWTKQRLIWLFWSIQSVKLYQAHVSINPSNSVTALLGETSTNLQFVTKLMLVLILRSCPLLVARGQFNKTIYFAKMRWI